MYQKQLKDFNTIQDYLRYNITKIKDMINQGFSYKKIGKELGNINDGNVYFFCRNNNILNKNKLSDKYGEPLRRKDEIYRMLQEGKNATQIAKVIGVKTSSMCKFIAKYFPEIQLKTTFDKDNLLCDKTEEVLKMNADGMTANSIAIKLGHSSSAVWKILRKHNKDTSKKLISVDESFFEKIDTEEKAYVLGMMYSDGNVRENIFRITLCIDDVDVLNKIKGVLKYEGNLSYRQARNSSSKEQMTLSVGRTKMAQDLIKLGCKPAKSLILTFPTEDIVPKDLLRHFLRGVFDGDGSIGDGYASITGSYYFIYGLADILPFNYTNIYKRYKDRKDEDTAHSISLSRQCDYIPFLKWMYTDATIYMDRKYNRYLEILNKEA